MKILITGGCGFIGSNLAIFLKDKIKNVKISSIDNLSRKGSKLNYKRLAKKKIKNFKKDIAISSKFNKLPKFDLIIHCAAEPAIEASRKKMEEVFKPQFSEPQSISKTSPGLVLLKQVRDESHRFAISFHREIRDKGMFV